ncbi:helix-turn-helix domain-containing protein [Fictibacillus nanhaiensis]|uniref:helix-turn-helix domain-containing protein n=1 Tax=Fictibacillus nanhaiensis TaxID=742169 RepID=UPI002E23934D|nr:helix-turn-helix domain-containing protein [Fictibacillus nanhaiensis]
MTKYAFEIKLEAVLAYLEGKASLRDIANQFNVSLFSLRNWVNHYRENGEKGLLNTYTKYENGRTQLHERQWSVPYANGSCV